MQGKAWHGGAAWPGARPHSFFRCRSWRVPEENLKGTSSWWPTTCWIFCGLRNEWAVTTGRGKLNLYDRECFSRICWSRARRLKLAAVFSSSSEGCGPLHNVYLDILHKCNLSHTLWYHFVVYDDLKDDNNILKKDENTSISTAWRCYLLWNLSTSIIGTSFFLTI